MSINCRVLQVVPVMVFGALLFFTTGVYAETIYLKDGTIIRGAVKSEDEKSIFIEMGDTWKSVDKSNIESMSKDTVPAEAQAETKVQAQQSSAATSRTVTDLRLSSEVLQRLMKCLLQGPPLLSMVRIAATFK